MLCPCGTCATCQTCCGPFHKGKLPISALQLMRSRYSAYALDLPDYILETTHPDNPHYLSNRAQFAEQIRSFSQTTLFERLEILETGEKGEMATVTFVAHLKQNGKEFQLREKSLFQKVHGKWLYLGMDS